MSYFQEQARNSIKKTIPALFLVFCLASTLPMLSCGPDQSFDSMSLTLNFSPKDIPAGTFRLNVYVLPNSVMINQQEEVVNCDLFVGPTADKNVFDYTSFLVTTPIQVTFNPDDENAISIKELPEGLLVFIVEAVDEPGSQLALGCGMAQIERGKKVFISIYMQAS